MCGQIDARVAKFLVKARQTLVEPPHSGRTMAGVDEAQPSGLSSCTPGEQTDSIKMRFDKPPQDVPKYQCAVHLGRDGCSGGWLVKLAIGT